MKRVFSLLLAMSVFFLAACAEQESSSHHSADAGRAASETAESGAGDERETSGENVLIAYFSWADNAVLDDDVDAVASPSVLSPGNVQQLAGWIQEETGGELFSIRVADLYPSDWDECLERANQERGEDARPELVENVENLDQYDTIFLGYPKIQYGFFECITCIK